MKLDSQIEDLKIKFKSLNNQLLNSENLGNKEIIQINKELSKLEPVINIANEIQRLEKEIIGYRYTQTLVANLNSWQAYVPEETIEFYKAYRRCF